MHAQENVVPSHQPQSTWSVVRTEESCSTTCFKVAGSSSLIHGRFAVSHLTSTSQCIQCYPSDYVPVSIAVQGSISYLAFFPSPCIAVGHSAGQGSREHGAEASRADN